MGQLVTQQFELTAPEPKQPTYMEMIDYVVKNGGAIDAIERLAALQRQSEDRQAEAIFNTSMTGVQSELGRIAPDLTNPQTHSKYASYAALDRKIRPIYTKYGFSLSFDSGDSPTPETVRVICYVSHSAGHTRKYMGPPMPADGKGAKGGDVMTKTHATGAAMSYGARYLLKYIFNIAVGEEDLDGNDAGADPNWLNEQLAEIGRCETEQGLVIAFQAAAKHALEASDMNAYNALKRAKNARKKELEAK